MCARDLELWHLLPFFLFANMAPTLAAFVDPIRICSFVKCAYSTFDAVGSVKKTVLRKRSPSVRYLSGNWVLYYRELASFTSSWNVAFSLGYFWVQIAVHLSSLEEERFQRDTVAMHMMLGVDGNDMGLGLQLKVFNMYGTVPREIMLAMTSTMMGLQCGISRLCSMLGRAGAQEQLYGLR